MSTPRVLVADDSHTLRTYVRRTLMEAGYDVELAADGDEALKLLRDQCPALAILDINMPGTNGYAVLSCLKSMGEPWSTCPIILMTHDQSHALEILGAQVGAFLHKPVSPRVLVDTVGTIVQQQTQHGIAS